MNFNVAYVETTLYILGNDGFHQALYIATLVAHILHLRKSSIGDVVSKRLAFFQRQPWW